MLLKNKPVVLTLLSFFLSLKAEAMILEDKDVAFQIYSLHPNIDIIDALKEKKNKNGEIREYFYYECEKKQGCYWYGVENTNSVPSFWNVVSEGTGLNLKKDNDENTREQWLYCLKSKDRLFGIVFQNGGFFKTKDKRIQEEYGDPKFGERVMNSINNQQEILTSISITGGTDYCKIKWNSLKKDDFFIRIEELCNKLADKFVEAELYNFYIHEFPQKHNFNSLRKASDEDTEKLKKIKNSGEEVFELNVNRNKKPIKEKFIELLGEYWKIPNGLEKYIQETKEFVNKLIENEENLIELKYFEEESEGLYNIAAANQNKKLTCLDNQCVDNIEICDLFIDSKLIHVKRGTTSSELNHLFAQGLASATFLNIEDFRKKIPFELIRKKIIEKYKSMISNKFNNEKSLLKSKFLKWLKDNERKIKISTLSKTEVTAYTDYEESLIFLQNQSNVPPTISSFMNSIKQLFEEKILEKMSRQGRVLIECLKREIIKVNNFLINSLGHIKNLDDFKEDEELNQIKNNLNAYNLDLISKKIKIIFDTYLQTPERKLENNYDTFKEEIKKLYINSKNKSIDNDIFIQIIEDKKTAENFTTLFKGFSEKKFTVIYAIITTKESSAKNLLPIGSRISLIENVKKIQELGFDVKLKIIKDVSKKRKLEISNNFKNKEDKKIKSGENYRLQFNEAHNNNIDINFINNSKKFEKEEIHNQNNQIIENEDIKLTIQDNAKEFGIDLNPKNKKDENK